MMKYSLFLKYPFRFLLLALVLMVGLSSPAYGQKKEIQAARDQVKAGKDLDKAQVSMVKLLSDSDNIRNKKIWSTLFDAVRKQYEQGNEKLYLKQEYDTAKLFNHVRYLFEIAMRFDSIESLSDKKGRVEVVYRKPHAEYLSQIRSNLYNGGTWFIYKQQYEDAYRFFDQYLECANSQLFKHYDYAQNDKHLPTAAYYAVYSGYKMQDPKATLHHSYEALKDTVHYNYMLQYLAETYKLEGDTVRYLASLKEGFGRVPKFPYFFPRLVEYYVDSNKLDSAMAIVDSALVIVPDSDLYLATKGSIALALGQYQLCIDSSQKAIQQNPDMEDAYYNIGMAYFDMAVEKDKNAQTSRKMKDLVENYYKQALPYLVRYRELSPDMQSKWAFPLYTIYLNLNMGKEFDEIDKIMNQKKTR